MIPTPCHFRGIHREAGMHPDVLAEIDAARRRAEAQVSAKPEHPAPRLAPRWNWTWPVAARRLATE